MSETIISGSYLKNNNFFYSKRLTDSYSLWALCSLGFLSPDITVESTVKKLWSVTIKIKKSKRQQQDSKMSEMSQGNSLKGLFWVSLFRLGKGNSRNSHLHHEGHRTNFHSRKDDVEKISVIT